MSVTKLDIQARGCGCFAGFIVVIFLVVLILFCGSCNAQMSEEQNISSSQSRWTKKYNLRSVSVNGDMNYVVVVQFEHFERDKGIDNCDTFSLPLTIPFSLSVEDREKNIEILVALNFSKWMENRDKFKDDLKILQRETFK